MIIAVTFADEVNMVACQIAHSLFDVPTKIARVRHQSYLQSVWANLFSRDHMPIDVIISPELEVARAIARRLKVPGAFEMIPPGRRQGEAGGSQVRGHLPPNQHPHQAADPAFP